MILTVDKLTYGPDAIGRIDNTAVFVSGAIPGDMVEVKVTSKQKNYMRAEVVKVIKRSDKFQKAPCPVYDKCGGCHWQNLSYAAQLDWKHRIISETLKHLGGVEGAAIDPVIGCKRPFGYRNKSQHPVGAVKGSIVTGFFERGSHKIVPVEKCMLETELGNRVIVEARKLIGQLKLSVYNEKTFKGLVRHLIVRTSEAYGTAILTVVTTGRFSEENELAFALMKKVPALKGIVLNLNSRRDNVILGNSYISIAGERQAKEKIGGLEFVISPGAFFQTNSLQAEQICRSVETMAGLKGTEMVLDLYSGGGMIGMYLARNAANVVLVEENPHSTADALENARINNLENLRFYEGRAEDVLKKATFLKKSDIIVLDPPRQGVYEGIIKWIGKSKATKVVYVSCDLATFSRDVKRLAGTGFVLDSVVPIDMFPQTFHVEVVAGFVRAAEGGSL